MRTTWMAWACAATVFWATAGGAAAQSAFLGETNLRDTCFQNDLTMKLTGKVSVQQNGQTVQIARSAEATHQYVERFLDVKDGAGERSARFYNRADAVIADQQDKFTLSLKANHALVVAHRIKDQLVAYHPQDPLSREEMEAVSHFDTLAVPGLLPRKETAVGETWSVPRDVVQAITDLDALEKSDLVGKLDKIDGDFAYVSFKGLIQGVDLAAPVSILVKDSSLVFNLRLKRVTSIDWNASDQRAQGPVSPALGADVRFELKRVPVDLPTSLGDVALVKVPSGPPPAKLTNLSYRNLKKGFEVQFAREWHMVNQTADGKLVLRLVDGRGEFIAQCTVTPWTTVAPANAMKLPEFAKMMRESKGWVQKDGPAIEESDKIASTSGYAIFRVTAEGKLGEVDAVRSFYLVATPEGNQMLVDFTMLPTQASKLDGRDVALVQSIQFLATTPARVEAVPASQSK